MKIVFKLFLLICVSGAILTACSSGSDSAESGPIEETDAYRSGELDKGQNTVVVHELSDPDKLNPVTSTAANSQYIQNNLFLYLIEVDQTDMSLVPMLAESRPTITPITEGEFAGGMSIEYRIRPEAKWDNGSEVTAHDVAFTYKAVKNQHVDSEHFRPYLEFIDHMEIDPEDDKHFTFYSSQQYFAAEYSSGGMVQIIPEYLYDPEQIMRGYTIRELNDPENTNKFSFDKELLRFADLFHDEKFQRQPGFVSGAGPYELIKWETGQRVILQKKENWWGDQLAGKSPRFEAYPDRLNFEIINDWTTAINALKGRQVDVIRNIRAKDYRDLEGNERFRSSHHLFQPSSLSYTYVGMNMKHPIFSDLKVRKAFNHLVDKTKVIDIIMYGLADPTNGPIHPSKAYYNDQLEAYEFDLKKAQQLLEEAGWTDSDGDGILDKEIDGARTDFSVTFKYNSGNSQREKVGIFLKENARKLGIDMQVVSREWTVYLDEVKNHDFDLFCLGWVQEAVLDDPKQIWYTDAYNGGSNYVGFGDEATDRLIDELRAELDEGKRNQMYMELQERIHEQSPYIFLYTPLNRLTMSKRFDNTEPYVARPGYFARGLKLIE